MSMSVGERLREWWELIPNLPKFPTIPLPIPVPRTSSVVSTLPDGTHLVLRPPSPRDAERLRRMFYRLSPTTIYRRLFLPVPRAPHWADHFVAFAAVDDARRAMVALIADEIVGIANYTCIALKDASDKAEENEDDDEAEMAIVVEDAWQGRGVGRLLLARLAKEAVDRRIGAFTARILGENVRALCFVTRFSPGAHVRWDEGEYEVWMGLAWGRVGTSADVRRMPCEKVRGGV